jgi:proline iminopeptidase
MIQRAFCFFLCFITIATIEPESLNAAPVQTSIQAVRERKLSRNGLDLFFRIVGDKGPLVIILAGGPGADPGYMQPVFTELSKNYQCVVFEQRGTGRSKLRTYDFRTVNFQAYLEDLEALRTELKQKKLLLLGNSWGAMLALSYAGTYPNRAGAVVSIDSGPIAEEHAAAEEANVIRRLLPSELQEIGEWEKRKTTDPSLAFGKIQRIMMTAYFQDRQKAAQSLGLIWPGLNIEVMRLGYQPEFGSLQKFIRSRLRAIKAPVLLVHGRQDPVAEGGVAEAHSLIRRSQLVLINNCGHLPWLEQPDQFWESVNAFLKALQK